ncbi:metallophosphoesterase [Clostridium sp. ZBS15]|uniref:metallophosphoesterase family protein n=1 Tax=Clostridium sp. ZBS15 TaxID=2949969 RepID=UPI00207950D0|nr:metallophosphoesterase [Clostridium sp. ZBS15]
MKIFATSDIHGDFNAYKEIVHFVNNKVEDIDTIMFAGDITGKHLTSNLEELISLQEKDYTFFKVRVLSKINKKIKVMYILGNDDWIEEQDLDNRYILTHLDNDSNILGFELIHITPFSTNREETEDVIYNKFNKLNIKENESIILSHTPPYKVLDKCIDGTRAGSKSIREIILKKKPKLYICGHIHEDFGSAMLGDTLILNCACDYKNLRGWYIDTDTMKYREIYF